MVQLTSTDDHDVSTAALDMLKRATDRTGGLSNPMWAFFGVAIGSVKAAGVAFYEAFIAIPPTPTPQSPQLSLGGLADILIFAVCASVFVCIYVVSRKRASQQKAVEDWIQEIRERQRVSQPVLPLFQQNGGRVTAQSREA